MAPPSAAADDPPGPAPDGPAEPDWPASAVAAASFGAFLYDRTATPAQARARSTHSTHGSQEAPPPPDRRPSWVSSRICCTRLRSSPFASAGGGAVGDRVSLIGRSGCWRRRSE